MRDHAPFPSRAAALRAAVLPLVLTALPAQGSPTEFKVSTYGAYPNGTNAGPGIRQAIAAADATPNSIVQFDAGTYLVDPASGAGLALANLTDVVLQGFSAGTTTIAFRDRHSHGVVLKNCGGVQFRDLVLTYLEPCHFEAILTTASPGTAPNWVNTYTLNCPTPVNPNDSFLFATNTSYGIHVFDPKTRSRRPFAAKLKATAAAADPTGTTVTLTLQDVWSTNAPLANASAPGDVIAVGREVGSHLVWSESSNRLVFDSVRLERAPMFGAQHTFDLNVTYRNCTIGAAAGSQQPLLSTNRDGLRFRSLRGSPQVLDCRIERCGDDAINVHSQWLRVAQVDPLTGTALLEDAEDPDWAIDVQMGDELSVFHDASLSRLGFGTVTSAVPIPNSPKRNVLCSGITLAAGQRVLNATAQATNVRIEGNRMRDLDARGILLRAIGGSIQRNQIVGAPKGGIVVSPDVQYFQEAGFSRSLAIAENAIHVSGFGRWHHNSATTCNLGALTIGVEHAQFAWPSGFGHAEMLVADNWIATTSMVGIFLASTDSVNLTSWMPAPLFGADARNNWVLASQLAPNAVPGSNRGIRNATGGLHVLHVANTSIATNRIDHRGNGTGPVSTTGAMGPNTGFSANQTAWSTSFETEESLSWNGTPVFPFTGRILATASTPASVGGWQMTFRRWHLQGRDPVLDVARGYQCTVCPTTGGSLTIQVPNAAQATTCELAFWVSLGSVVGGTPQPLLVHAIDANGTITSTIPATALPTAPHAQLFQFPLLAGTTTIQFQRLASNAELFLDDVVVVY